jgi:hypothetical protein
MRKIFLFVVISLSFSAIAFAQLLSNSGSLDKQWETLPGLRIPESVLYDTTSGVVYVSNIDGNPSVKDSTGFISTISTDGKILNLHWVKGIDAPKGMGILNNRLFVSNIDEIVEIDIPSAAIVKRHAVKGSTFLNDIAIDVKTGMIFITDTGTGQVYVLREGVLSLWLQGPMFKGANGLHLNGNTLYIGTANSIMQADIVSGAVKICIPGTGSVDGLYLNSDNDFIYSDWKGSIFKANSEMKPVLLINTSTQKQNAADFGVIPSKNLIMVPTFSDNKVVCYKLSLIR